MMATAAAILGGIILVGLVLAAGFYLFLLAQEFNGH